MKNHHDNARVVRLACVSGRLLNPRVSRAWLSGDMPFALAAMCPPLETTHVVEAADKLAEGVEAAYVIDDLLRNGANLMTARRVVEALRALRDARVTDSSLAAWLLAHETGIEVTPLALSAAAERVCQKLGPRLTRLVSSDGTRGLVSRALHVARAHYPFLDGARAGTPPEACFEGLTDRMHDIDVDEAGRGLRAVLGILLDLLVAFMGEDLTLMLLRDVWPDLALPQPGRPNTFDWQEADHS